MINIAKPMIGDDEKNAVIEVLDSGQLAQGPRVEEFEERFARYVDAPYAIATTSGTTALHIAMMANNITSGDEVITSPFSFIASANCALFIGAKPVFADIEYDHFTINPKSIEEHITEKTRAIIPVHLFGQSCDMESIADIAAKYQLVIIEDACQSHGARLNDKPMGSWGTACYSFYPTKNMTTIEGGMITTHDPLVADKARLLRNHGSSERYVHSTLGYNFRMTDLQAAIGLVQLNKIEQWNNKRISNANYLNSLLSLSDDVVTPEPRPGAHHVYHQYTVRVQNRERAIDALSKENIGHGIYYPIPIHRQPLYTNLGYTEALPVAETASNEVLSLPVHPGLSENDLDLIANALISGLT